MGQFLRLNELIATVQNIIAGFNLRFLVFLIIPLSVLAHQLAGQIGLLLSALLLPAALLSFRNGREVSVTMANGDGLTGLPTPSQIDLLTTDWPEKLAMDRKRTACFMVQVDRFAEFLTRYGDTAGFHLQRSFAERLGHVLRDDDLITRVADGSFKCLIQPVK